LVRLTKARRESLPGGHFSAAQPLLVHESKGKAQTSWSPKFEGILAGHYARGRTYGLHRDLRTIAKAYIARLENDLFVCLAALRSCGPIEHVPREMLYQIRDLTIIVRNRKLKPKKGRRKDLRKIDSLIVDLVSTIGRKN